MGMASVMKEAYHAGGCAVEIVRPAFGEQGAMAETEVVSRFKEFARIRLLAPSSGGRQPGLSKTTDLGEIR
jgi:hypothetical protein